MLSQTSGNFVWDALKCRGLFVVLKNFIYVYIFNISKQFGATDEFFSTVKRLVVYFFKKYV